MSTGYILEPQKKDLRWWDKECYGNNQAESLFAAFRKCVANDKSRLDDYRAFTRIYENRDHLGLGPESHARRRRSRQPGTVVNATKQVVDTITAKIAKTRPHVTFQTFNGNASLRRRAKHLERWVEAEQYRSGQERLGPDVFKDCCIYGTGIYKHFSEKKDVLSERVHPAELFVDHVEAWDGTPSQYFHRKYIDRDTLCRDFPKHAEEIKRLAPAYTGDGFGLDHLADQLEVVEAHKVGAGGRQTIAVNGDSGGLVLQDRPWTRSEPPYTFIRWTNPRRGFWGIGLVEEVMPLHLDLNKTLRQIQKNLGFGNFQVWMEQAAKIKGQGMSNKVGGLNTFRRTPPVFATIDPVSASLLLHADKQYQRIFAQAGVSADSATGSNTLGADVSGKSRRMFHDLETVRFAIIARQWEWLWLDSAKHYITLGKEISKRHKKYSVVAAKDRYTVSQLDWSEVDMDQDSYVIRCAPISALSDLPSSRRAEVAELQMMGAVQDPSEVKRLLDMPDLDEHMALDRAASDNIDRIIEAIVDEGRYEAPEPFQDHQLALKKAQAAYNKAIIDKVPEKHLAALRQYMVATNQHMQQAQAAQQGMAQPGAPGVPPAPGPTGQSPTAVLPTDGPAA